MLLTTVMKIGNRMKFLFLKCLTISLILVITNYGYGIFVSLEDKSYCELNKTLPVKSVRINEIPSYYFKVHPRWNMGIHH